MGKTLVLGAVRRGFIRLPREWASALINGDYSGLEFEDEEGARECRERENTLADEGILIIGMVEGDETDYRGFALYETIDYVECDPTEWAVRCLCAFVDRMGWPSGAGPDYFAIPSIEGLPAIVDSL